MYEEFFGFERRPFAATPDADCFIPLEGPQGALDALAVSCERGQGIGVLTGGAGLGKTLVGLRLAFELQPTLQTVFLHHSSFPTRRALLQAILFELHRPYSRMAEQELRLELTTSLKALRPEKHALALILDEAHQLSDALLDELRLLAMLADHGEPLARIVLIGNPDLEEKLANPALAAFNQRVCCQVELAPLTQAESVEYLRESVRWAGVEASDMLTNDALNFISRAADGSPRCLNQLADHTLLLAYVGDQRMITDELAQQALEDLKQLPLMWHDPIRGGEIYRGRQQAPPVEESAVDLWPNRETTTPSNESVEFDTDLAPLDHNSAAVEIGGELELADQLREVAVSSESVCDISAAKEQLLEEQLDAEQFAEEQSLAEFESDDAPEIGVSELTCLRQDWAMTPPPVPHTNKWSEASQPTPTDDRLTGETDVATFDSPQFGQTFGARDAQFGSPSADSFRVEEFASADWQHEEAESSLCDVICQSASFAANEHESSNWIPESRFNDSADDIDFEEEPVIDRYVRHQKEGDTAGLVWDINALRKHQPTQPVILPPTDREDFAEILASPFMPDLPAPAASEDESGVVVDFPSQHKLDVATSEFAEDSADAAPRDNKVDWHDEQAIEPTSVELRADDSEAISIPVKHFSGNTGEPMPNALGLSDHDTAPEESSRTWQHPSKLLDATNAEDDIESQIGADVLDLYLSARHGMSGRPAADGTSSSQTPLPNKVDWSDLEAALNDGDEWSDEPTSGSHAIEPEPTPSSIRESGAVATIAPPPVRQPDVVQRAYSRLFSELRAKQR